MAQTKLPGTAVRPKLGRHRRGLDELARYIRGLSDEPKNPVLTNDVLALRGLADQLDAIESAGGSEYTYVQTMREYLSARDAALARHIRFVSAEPSLSDVLTRLIDPS